MIDGYSGERRALEEQVRKGSALQQQLEAELQMTNNRLEQLQQERREVSDQQDLLLQQQEAIIGGATETELSMLCPVTSFLLSLIKTFNNLLKTFEEFSISAEISPKTSLDLKTCNKCTHFSCNFYIFIT